MTLKTLIASVEQNTAALTTGVGLDMATLRHQVCLVCSGCKTCETCECDIEPLALDHDLWGV